MKKRYLAIIYLVLIVLAGWLFFFSPLDRIIVNLLVIIILIYIVKKPLARLTEALFKKKLYRIAVSTILNLVWIVFLFWLVLAWNSDLFIALLSFFIVAISFTMRNVMNNIASGALMLTQEQFEVGDLIETNAIQGRVEEVTLNYTKIREFDGVSVVIPNSNVYGSVVTKFTHKIEQILEIPYRDEDETIKKSYERYLSYFGRLMEKDKKVTRYAKSVQILSELEPKLLKPRLNEIFEKYEDIFGIIPDYVVDKTTHQRLQLDLLITAKRPELLLNYIDPFLRDVVFNLYPDIIYRGWDEYKTQHNIQEKATKEGG